MLQCGVSCQHRIVGFHNSGGHLRSRIDGELEFGLLSVVDGETLHQQRRKSGAGAAAEAVEDEESLETRALVGQLPDAIENGVDELLATV